MHTWQKKVYTPSLELQSDHLYLAQFVDGTDAEDNKVKFEYDVITEDGEKIKVSRRIDSDAKPLRHWLRDHTGYDIKDPKMSQMKSSWHLVLISRYNGYVYVAKVFSLPEGWTAS